MFRQVHKVLAMEPMYSQNKNLYRGRRNNRKRRREDTEGGENEDGELEKKIFMQLKSLKQAPWDQRNLLVI